MYSPGGPVLGNGPFRPRGQRFPLPPGLFGFLRLADGYKRLAQRVVSQGQRTLGKLIACQFGLARQLRKTLDTLLPTTACRTSSPLRSWPRALCSMSTCANRKRRNWSRT